MDPPYSMIDQLAEMRSVTEANSLLNQGWVLIKSAELLGVDEQGHQITTITYILGHVKQRRRSASPKNGGPAPSSPSPAEQQVDAVNRPKTSSQGAKSDATPLNILSLPIQWRQKKDLNPNFYYAFVFGLDGELDPIVSSVVYAIRLSNGGTIEQDGWRFTVSKDGKFLHRSKHSQAKVVSSTQSEV
jgi:hypothetical protein